MLLITDGHQVTHFDFNTWDLGRQDFNCLGRHGSINIAKGERVRKYVLKGFNGKTWKTIGGGRSVGHKRIEMLINPLVMSKIKLLVLDSEGTPIIKEFGAF